jgi:hypothetical protein
MPMVKSYIRMVNLQFSLPVMGYVHNMNYLFKNGVLWAAPPTE